MSEKDAGRDIESLEEVIERALEETPVDDFNLFLEPPEKYIAAAVRKAGYVKIES